MAAHDLVFLVATCDIKSIFLIINGQLILLWCDAMQCNAMRELVQRHKVSVSFFGERLMGLASLRAQRLL